MNWCKMCCMRRYRVQAGIKGYAVYRKYRLGWFRDSPYFRTKKAAQAALELRDEIYN